MKSEMRRELKATVAATFVVRFSRWLRSPFARSACHFPRWKILVSPPTRLAFPEICYDHRAAPSFFFFCRNYQILDTFPSAAAGLM